MPYWIKGWYKIQNPKSEIQNRRLVRPKYIVYMYPANDWKKLRAILYSQEEYSWIT
jgi:hypothetical protein